MAAPKTLRKRKTFRFDGQRLREERALLYDPKNPAMNPEKDPKKTRLTQEQMAKLIDIHMGISPYQKAERGECVDELTKRRIIDYLSANGVDAEDLGLRPCTDPPPPDTSKYLEDLHHDCSFIDVRS